MFLQLSIILFTGWGVYPSMQWAGDVYSSMQWGREVSARGCLPGGFCQRGVCLSTRGVSAQGVSAQGVSAGVVYHPLTETATEAGSTQPTGMHSCSTYFMNFTQGDSERLSLAVASDFSALVVDLLN